jgi:ATP phosphoribosyltransferase regulatory subunit
MRVSAALPTGVAALLFESARARRRLEGRLVELVESRGYDEAILPILDYLEPYESLLTPASRGELYRFIDRDGEQLALRADFTPMLARLLAPRLASLRLPLRLFYRGDVVRYEAGHAAPRSWRRELYQLGVELLSAPADAGGPEAAEREVLVLFLEALAAAGGRHQVVLGLAGCLDAALLAARGESAAGLAAAVERRERSAVRRASPVLLPIVESGLPAAPEDLGAAAAARLRWLLALREELAGRFPQVRLHIDLAEFARYHRAPELAAAAGARSYYDGLVFHAHAGAAAVPVGGGGRYGSLFRALGAAIDAVGFSLSLDALSAITAMTADGREEERA